MKKLHTRPNIGKRIAATLIDYGVILTFFIAYVFAVGEPNQNGGYTVTGVPALAPVAFWFLYLVVIEYICGATVGHAINGLSVTSIDDTKPSFSQILKRRVGDAFDLTCSFGIVALILIKNTQYNQRLGDIWGKVIVFDKHVANDDAHDFEFQNNSTPG